MAEEGGGYKYEELRRNFRQLIQFKKNFPDPAALVEVVIDGEYEEDEQFNCELLGELGAWIIDLNTKCEQYKAREAVLEREREAEEEKERAERMERLELRPRRTRRKAFEGAEEQTEE